MATAGGMWALLTFCYIFYTIENLLFYSCSMVFSVLVLVILFLMGYRKIPKISDTRKFIVITLKVEQDGFTLE